MVWNFFANNLNLVSVLFFIEALLEGRNASGYKCRNFTFFISGKQNNVEATPGQTLELTKEE